MRFEKQKIKVFSRRSNIVFVLFFFFSTCLQAQDHHIIDSLEQVISIQKNECPEPCPSDTLLISTYQYWESLISVQDPDFALILDDKALEVAQALIDEFPDSSLDTVYKGYLADILNNIGYVYAQIKSNPAKGVEYFSKSLELYEELGSLEGLSTAYNNIGFIYDTNGDVSRALEYYHKSLKINEQNDDKEGIAISFNNIGNIYDVQGDAEKALEYYYKSLNLWEELDDKSGLALSYNNIGTAYQIEGNISKVIEYFNKSLEIYIETNDREGIALAYNNLGFMYDVNDSTDKALEFYKKSIKISKEIGNQQMLVSSYLYIGEILFEKEAYSKAKDYITEAYQISKGLAIPSEIERTATAMKELSIIQGDYKKAFEYHLEEIAMHDSIQNEENYRIVQKQQAFYEYDKQAAVDSIAHQKTIQIKDLSIAKQKMISLFTFAGIAILLVFLIMVFRLLTQKKKANHLLASQKAEILEKNEELNQLVEEVITQRDEIESKKHQLESIHYDLSNSIDYATRLQKSILPNSKLIRKHLSDHFVLLKPKDKVSGDFYWWTHIENHTVIAGVDCTGHGVPGAFMSMLGISFLREIVQKEYVTHTGVILRKLRKEIIKTLKQKGELGSHKDGMDMALISINHENNILQFSGANNPLYLILNSELQVINGDDEKNSAIKQLDGSEFNVTSSKFFYEIKPDKMPIAIYERMDKFTSHEIQLNTGDQVYMFSDGFPDQFGGPKDKKFKYKPFKQIFFENADKPMKEQQKVLKKAFEDWKGYQKQIDDVLVLGIKI